MTEVLLRVARDDDIERLWEFLALAAYEPDAQSAQRIPVVAAQLEGWQRPGDFGVIAELGGQPVGAVWVRQFHPTEEPSVYVDEHTPELAIGVKAAARGNGIGFALLSRLISDARQRGLGLCLNVRSGNAAVRLYERVGFRRILDSEVKNRVGGISFNMMLSK